jgi:anti-sigma regulatory factor (Ser/Thr protein kinase)
MTARCAQHDMLMYETDDELARQAGAFLCAGLDADAAVIAVGTQEKRSILREVIGARSAHVEFLDRDAVYTRPEDVLARFDLAARRLVRDGARAIRIYGELPVCETRAQRDGWIGYEAILNRAFADRPIMIMCGYDARDVPERIVAQGLLAHPRVLLGELAVNPHYRDPDELVESVARPPETLPDVHPVLFADDREFRERLAHELATAGVPPERAGELLLAAVEVLANARVHGNGVRALRVGRAGDRFVCEISDFGAGVSDPLAGYLPPAPAALAGAGLWIARQLTSRLDLVRSADGFSVRLWS